MKIEELFPGAIVLHDQTPKTIRGIYHDTDTDERYVHFYGDCARHYIEEIEPVPIIPEILMRLEGENGERFELVNGFYFINGGIRVWCEEDKMGVDWFYKNPFNGCFFGIGNINDVISRVRLDAGIFLTLKPE
jgi:hypothetical protein